MTPNGPQSGAVNHSAGDQHVEPPAVYFIDTTARPFFSNYWKDAVYLLLGVGMLAAAFTIGFCLLNPGTLRWRTLVLVNTGIVATLLVTLTLAISRPRQRGLSFQTAVPDVSIRAAPHCADPDGALPFWIADWWRERDQLDAAVRGICFPPGAVVIINMPELIAVRPVAQRFEPIQIDAEPDRLHALVAENRLRRPPATGQTAQIEEDAMRAAARRRRRRGIQRAVLISVPLTFAAWQAHKLGGPLLIGATVLVVGFIFYLLRLLESGRLLLIPGGLVVRESQGGRRQFRRIDARLHGLLFREDPYSRSVQLDLHAGVSFATVTVRPEAIAGILAGWLSTAPPPTDEQLREFLSGGEIA